MICRSGFIGVLTAMMFMGCGGSGGDYDEDLAKAYAEILIAEIQFPTDSAAWSDALEERLAGNRYSTAESVRAEIHRLAEEDASSFKRLLDSVYARLNSVQLEDTE